MEFADHRLANLSRFLQRLGLKNGGLLIAVNDVIDPSAQRIDRMDGSPLIGLKGTERRKEGR